jgi:tripartite-type tricarboxylate transporter receptor subunit TctC
MRTWMVTSALAGILATLSLAPSACIAQSFPSKPVRLLVGFPPGTATDIVARQLAEQLTLGSGWTVIVENKLGQAGSVAAAEVARAAPDGHTLLLSANGPLATNPNLYANVRYDTLKDFSAIASLVMLPYVLVVNAASPYQTVQDLVAAARATPTKLNYASPGNGSTGHLIGASFARTTDSSYTHIPYKGSAESLNALLGGSIDMLFDTSVVTVPLAQTHKLRPLAVSTGQRIASLPQVPTLKEAGVDLEMSAWLGIVAPAQVPAELRQRLNAAISQALKTPALRARLEQLGAQLHTGTPDEFSAFLHSELSKWAQAVRTSGAKVE